MCHDLVHYEMLHLLDDLLCDVSHVRALTLSLWFSASGAGAAVMIPGCIDPGTVVTMLGEYIVVLYAFISPNSTPYNPLGCSVALIIFSSCLL